MFLGSSNKQLFFIYRSVGLGVVLSHAEIGLPTGACEWN